MRYWKKLSQKDINLRINAAMASNVNFYEENILGIPGSHLDEKVFYQDAPFLHDAPFLSTLVHNPNHIGCHTIGQSESFFKGTQEIERELLNICAVDILKGDLNDHDGYVASGGTEANMQALWIFRNYFVDKLGARLDQIHVICSEDTHYSIVKACNILNVSMSAIPVEEDSRDLQEEFMQSDIQQQVKNGKKFFVVVVNMMTTMFGSVDNVDMVIRLMQESGCPFKIHVDGAYGGFFYPFANPENKLSFRNEYITSFSMDAHKMVQAPYGTGIFLIRKGYIEYARTDKASYVEGQDYTIVGSRSGANAVAVWMILMKNGPYEWKEKILILLNRANWVCRQLDKKGIRHFRQRGSNIITVRSGDIKSGLAGKYGLVPDNHQAPRWYKIVIMDHVTIDKLMPLMEEMEDKN